jgi:hypothetical protein
MHFKMLEKNGYYLSHLNLQKIMYNINYICVTMAKLRSCSTKFFIRYVRSSIICLGAMVPRKYSKQYHRFWLTIELFSLKSILLSAYWHSWMPIHTKLQNAFNHSESSVFTSAFYWSFLNIMIITWKYFKCSCDHMSFKSELIL